MNLLLSARDETGVGLTREEIRDELITLLLAGRDSVAAALSWMLLLIHTNPSVLETLLKEFASLGVDPDPVEVARLPYLSAVASETLRLYPITVIANPRIAQTSIQISGYEFQPQTRLIPCIYLTHRRSDLYPDPLQFRPERFLERQFSPYEYCPFGGSNRRCIGAAFASFEMKLIAWSILSSHRLRLMSVPKPVRHGTNLIPKGGLHYQIL